MRQIKIQNHGTIKLNSFIPLCTNELGRIAIRTYNYPPFIDASCRREPDFQNTFPSISALCRKGKFAPHLRKGHIAVYITVKGHYPPHPTPHHRLVAILQVEDNYPTHQQGQIEYLRLGATTPSNCIVTNNPSYNFDQTAGNFMKKELKTFLSRTPQQQQIIGQRRLHHWNNDYFKISQCWTCFVRTTPLYLNLTAPVPVFRKDFEKIFGKLPSTRTAKKITEEQLIGLAKLVELDINFT